VNDVQEFELISHESECMKRKLLSQEDEFRLQNETLMTELGQVSVINDKIWLGHLFYCLQCLLNFNEPIVQKNLYIYHII